MYLRHTNIRKRLLIHAGGFNLGLLMRQLIGVGRHAGYRDASPPPWEAFLTLIWTLREAITWHRAPVRLLSRLERLSLASHPVASISLR